MREEGGAVRLGGWHTSFVHPWTAWGGWGNGMVQEGGWLGKGFCWADWWLLGWERGLGKPRPTSPSSSVIIHSTSPLP